MIRTSFTAWQLAVAGPWIGRRAGQRLARRELAKVGFIERVLRWIGNLIGATGSVLPRGLFGLILLALLAAAAVVLVLTWARPGRAGRARGSSVLASQHLSARDYRHAAERLATGGRYGQAILERVRAIAAELNERAILQPRPGRTADELAFEASRELPGLAAQLRSATALFDDIAYGQRDGTQDGYQLVSQVDAQVQAAHVAPGQAPPAAELAVPR
jgi:Domain of unknown function (DUF4129)